MVTAPLANQAQDQDWISTQVARSHPKIKISLEVNRGKLEKSVCYKFCAALEQQKPKWRCVCAKNKTLIVHETHNKCETAHLLLLLALFVH